MGREDRFVIASVTKMIVACAAMSMFERGRLDLDRPVGRWLPNLPNSDRVTTRMLLSHRSGLREYFDDGLVARRIKDEPFRNWTRQEVLEAVERLGPETEPGKLYAYRNSNYLVLGELLETLSCNSIEQLVQELVRVPLGLKTVSFDRNQPEGARIVSPHVARFGRVFDPLLRTGGGIPNDAMGGVWTDGGIAASAEDIALFTEALFEGKLLQPETIEAMTTPPDYSGSRTGKMPDVSYGLGVVIYHYRGARALGHAGMYLGWSSVTTFDTRARTTVTVLTNLASPKAPAEKLGLALLNVLD